MKFAKILITMLLFTATTGAVFAQEEEEKGSLNSGTIESQFDYLYKKSGKYQEYRVIKTNNLFKFKGNITDTLKLARKKYLESQNVIASQKANIDSLNVKLQATKENLSAVTEEKDSISLLGIPMSKAGYNTILWTIIAALTGLLLFFIGKFKRSNAITVEAKKAKAEIEEEYEGHRQRSIEREQKLRRELQDELNKQKYADQATKKK
ncbi:tRNA (guanine-N1)-methyltransferase [Aureibaculum sp. 2210JD6-5]|uniref:tRNA (guanine-N1)-methyltransferase n=1 Tax=Aureibaculum sp. 2210JD6-5 TaxID=3103957 RepID=UPI002AAE3C03|nr:tRNA (guanine-N1)-methyltransferase [Aureibaculum sp. 2210JD6-5]MDY7395498.1 tRNA (guanine-N1)-methyltransferase [Aureibaculum sp. 2210JD6-5]